MSIKLKNINLNEVTMIDQIRKVGEEHCEFITAVLKKDSSNAIEEFYDLLQAGLGALDKMNINAEKVMEQYPKHLEKIKNRPRDKEANNICNLIEQNLRLKNDIEKLLELCKSKGILEKV